MKTLYQILIWIWIFNAMSFQLFAQNDNDKDKEKKDWIEQMQDEKSDFKELQKSFKDHWKDRTDYKGNGWKVFKRWEYINEFRILPNGKRQDPDYVYKTYLKYISENPQLKSASGAWSLVAPQSYPTNNTSQPTGMGRINAIAFHPTDANTIFIGSPSGGFWKTTDQGSNWTDLTANMPTLGVSSILIHPTDPNTIYIGSGDRDADDAPGMGVFKSTNGGSTWVQINSGMGNATVGAMLMHPTNPDVIIAATSSGIYKTINGGTSWSQKISANFKDIKFKPGDPTVIYAAYSSSSIGARFYRSSNTGDNWTHITSGILNAGTAAAGARMVIGVTLANPEYVYLVQIKQTDKNFQALLRSTDSGLNFTTQSTTPNIFDYACDGSGTASQATYDLCIEVDPANANTLYVGSINNWKSTDGGASWTIVSHWSNDCSQGLNELHADQHCYTWNSGKLYVGHDGGISYTDNGGTSWTEITNNLPITQIYRIGQSATQSDIILYGQQDNGSNARVGTALYTTRGGDGTECIVDYTNTDYCYNTYAQGEIKRSETGPAGSYSDIALTGSNGIGTEESGAWVTPYFLHKTNASVMFAGYENVFRCDNIKATPASSVTWTAISTGETTTCRILEQSPANVDIIYVVRSGAMKRTDNANAAAGSVTWTACSLPGGTTPTDVKAHPTLANVVYASAGYKIYKSENYGATWSDISGTLPGLYINCLVIDKTADEGIYIGNQTGIWYKNAGMTDWVLYSTGLPVVDIRELEIYYDQIGTQHRLKAATYGRGLWESDLYDEIRVSNPTSFVSEATSSTKIDLNWALSGGNNVLLAYSTNPQFGTPVRGTNYTATSLIPGGGEVLYAGNNTTFNHILLNPETTYYYKLWAYNGSAIYSIGTSSNAKTALSVADFTTDKTTSCTGNLTVSFTDASTAPYNSWAWDVDNDGTTDYTTQNPSHTYSSPGLYTVKLIINNGSAAKIKENLILVMNSSEPTVNTGCTLSSNSNSGNSFGIGIYRFALGNIDNTTLNNDGYYQNYTCSKWTLLELSKSYDITIRTGTANNEGAQVYIDYNDNGTFETGESVVSFLANKVGTRTLSFTTPSAGVIPDKGLRLRVLSRFGSIPATACDIGTYGQAEDYTVYFASPPTAKSSILAGGNWSAPATWSPSGVPGSTDNVIITSPGTVTVDVTSAVSNNLTVQSGATLQISPEKQLTVGGTFTNNSAQGLKIKSDISGTGSLIANAIAGTGTASIERYLPTNDWHLVSSPVSGLNMKTFADTYNNNIDQFEGTYDIGTHSEPLGIWNYNVSTGTSTDVFVYGIGNAIRRTVAAGPGTVTFTNPLYTSTQDIAITRSNFGWESIGNPFTSPMQIETFLSANSLQLAGSPYNGIYRWVNTDYQSATSGLIALAQGFFVKSKTGGGSVSFTSAMKTHGTDNFKSAEVEWPGITLVANAGNLENKTWISFNNEMTKGLDNMYDRGKLKGNPDIALFTRLLDDIGVDIETQALPDNGFDKYRIPVGIDLPAGGEVAFTALAKNLPGDVKLFLEDTNTKTFTSLGGPNDNYTVTLEKGTSGFGRFYLLTGDALTTSLPQPEIPDFYVFTRDKTIFINGPATGNTLLELYSIDGKLLYQGKAGSVNQNKIDGNHLPAGIYLLNIKSGGVTKTLKTVLN